jgi:lipopolysaccharide/colanic/teichoic acid biosynthesis glycosyltransferase
MRARLPTSRAAFKIRFSIIDFACAFTSPILALYLRDAYILTYDNVSTVAIYWTLSVGFSLMAFVIFRIHDGMSRYFSVHDALDMVKAAGFSQLMTTVVLFAFTRLDGIPRSTPFIQAMILAVGLIATRAIAQAFDNGAKVTNDRNNVAHENIIMIGATHVSLLYVKLLEACSIGKRRVIAVLDGRRQSIGRSIAGIRVLATPHHIESVIEEFVVHGIQTNRVIIGDEADLLTADELEEIKRVCEQHEIKLDFVRQLIGLSELPPAPIETTREAEELLVPNFELPRYFKFKPFIDFFLALAMAIISSPFLIFSAGLALLDVGSPVLFWQQRIGQGGRRFMLQKFRTLRPPFDWRGDPVPEREKLSLVGKFLRQTRIDELPQLLNILVGDMALIGPRPLLPEDQPENPATRLMVRPGITGWAQVNGGKFLTPEEKDQYDEYYIRNASPWFDLCIIFMTLKVLFRFTAHSDHKVAAASVVGFGKTEYRPSTSTANHPTARTGKAHKLYPEIESPPVSSGIFNGSPSLVKNSDRKIRSLSR